MRYLTTMARGSIAVAAAIAAANTTTSALSRDGSIAAAAMPVAPTPVPAPSPSPPGETTTSPQVVIPAVADGDMATRAEDVVDYTLRATLDPPTHRVDATGRIRWRNTSRRPVHELWMHLYLNAFKNERSRFLRERVGGRGSASPETWGSIDLRKLDLRDPFGGATDLLRGVDFRSTPQDDDETDVRVSLPRDVAPGEAIDLDVGFEDKLPAIVERTGYKGHFHMVGQWFPKIGRLEADGTWAHFAFHHLSEFYADFGTYDVTLDVPAAYTIGATGPAVETRIESGRRIERHVQSDIHDFAWTAWDRWETASESIDGVDVTILYPPGFERVAERTMAAVRFALPDDSARYGRYPYAVLTVVIPQSDASEAGGMEYPTLITGDGPWWIPRGILAPEIVTVHELGHQWFYGLVATNEAEWPFLDEGLNQYAETDTMARWRGEGSAADVFGLRLGDGAIQAVASNRAVHDERVAQSAQSFSTGANYARLVYSRTAAVIDTLARVYGPEKVSGALGRYARSYRFEHPGPEDFLKAFEDGVGPRAAQTLRAALFEKGWVDYAVDPIGEDSVIVRRRGTLSFPVDVELHFDDGSTRREPWSGQDEWTSVRWAGSSPPRAVVVDPDERVTIDANLENNFAVRPGQPSGAPRTLERLLYWMQLAIQAVAP